tara:strand:- start:2859 stop:2969 length:111 start_codon:yes stop_codon:yes gene_type:complete
LKKEKEEKTLNFVFYAVFLTMIITVLLIDILTRDHG